MAAASPARAARVRPRWRAPRCADDREVDLQLALGDLLGARRRLEEEVGARAREQVGVVVRDHGEAGVVLGEVERRVDDPCQLVGSSTACTAGDIAPVKA